MATPYIGEIRLVGFNFDPRGWVFCNGQLLDIATYETLFNLIGTTYGGDGQTTFAVPDLRGRVPIHQSNSNFIGTAAGSENVAISASRMPAHGHQLHVSAAIGNKTNPVGNTLARSPFGNMYGASGSVTMNQSTSAGSGVPHDNMQPYQVLNYVIAVEGVFPSQ